VNNYRLLFALAALYNAVFAVWSGLFPGQFFGSLFDIAPPTFLSIPWPPVAFVVGLLGLVYAAAACTPERADPLIAFGLASKIGGPVVWLVAASTGEWPVTTFPLVLAGDLVWWFPLLAFLLRRRPSRVVVVVWLSVVLHVAACVGLLLIAPATELGRSLQERQVWIHEHRGVFLAVWMLWVASSLSLLAVVGEWSNRLQRWPEARLAAVSACAVVACGVLLDLCGETSLIAWAPRTDISLTSFDVALRWYQLLSPAAANGLYCVGGMLLSLLSWWTGLVRGISGVLGFAMWTVGLALTAATLAGSSLAMVVTGAGVMLLYLLWAPLLAIHLSRADALAADG
jgi:hypothetical protein